MTLLKGLFSRRRKTPPRYVVGAAHFVIWQKPEARERLSEFVPIECLRVGPRESFDAMMYFIGVSHGSLVVAGVMTAPPEFLERMASDQLTGEESLQNCFLPNNLEILTRLAWEAAKRPALWKLFETDSSKAIDEALGR